MNGPRKNSTAAQLCVRRPPSLSACGGSPHVACANLPTRHLREAEANSPHLVQNALPRRPFRSFGLYKIAETPPLSRGRFLTRLNAFVESRKCNNIKVGIYSLRKAKSLARNRKPISSGCLRIDP